MPSSPLTPCPRQAKEPVAPAPAPPPKETREHVRSNVLLSKNLPPHYLQSCAATFGQAVADIAVQVSLFRLFPFSNPPHPHPHPPRTESSPYRGCPARLRI